MIKYSCFIVLFITEIGLNLNAQISDSIACKEMDGRFIQVNQEFQYETNTAVFHIEQINYLQVHHLVLFRENTSLEEMYKNGIFVNMWNSGHNSVIYVDCEASYFINDFILPNPLLLDYDCLDIPVSNVNYSSIQRIKREDIYSSKYWKRRLKGVSPSYTYYHCSFHFVEGGEAFITIPNYNYHWWMNNKKRAIKVKTKIYFITKFDRCVIEENSE